MTTPPPGGLPRLRLPASLAGRDVVVVDVEGNGQQPPEIIEIALLPLNATHAATVADLRCWLVRPTRTISPIVTAKVHGITDADLAGAPRWAEVADAVTAYLDGPVVVAHHAVVERRVLTAHLPGWRPVLLLDTLRLARKVWPGLPGGYGLDQFTALTDPPPTAGTTGPVEVSTARRHRAGYDVWLTAALFMALLAALADRGELTWAGLRTAAAVPARPTTRPAPPTDADEGGGLW